MGSIYILERDKLQKKGGYFPAPTVSKMKLYAVRRLQNIKLKETTVQPFLGAIHEKNYAISPKVTNSNFIFPSLS